MKHKLLAILAVIVILSAFCQGSSGKDRKSTRSEFAMPDSIHLGRGDLEQVIYETSVPGPTCRRLMVYLPETYYSDTTSKYPVLYLFHGARGNELAWIEKGDIIHTVDSLTATGKMSPTIIVMPNMNHYTDDEEYCFSRKKNPVESLFEVTGCVETSFMEDVVAMIDRRFRTIASKSGRAIAGLSIGALQSIYISAANPDAFDYVGLFSPMSRPVVRYGPYKDIYYGLKQKQEIQFANPPKVYWVMIGNYDIFVENIQYYANYLRRNGFKHEYICTGGGHTWKNWTRYCSAFLQNLW